MNGWFLCPGTTTSPLGLEWEKRCSVLLKEKRQNQPHRKLGWGVQGRAGGGEERKLAMLVVWGESQHRVSALTAQLSLQGKGRHERPLQPGRCTVNCQDTSDETTQRLTEWADLPGK